MTDSELFYPSMLLLHRQCVWDHEANANASQMALHGGSKSDSMLYFVLEMQTETMTEPPACFTDDFRHSVFYLSPYFESGFIAP